MATKNETFRQRTCRYVGEVFREREAFVEEHWSELMEGFCRENAEGFHNFIFTNFLTNKQV